MRYGTVVGQTELELYLRPLPLPKVCGIVDLVQGREVGRLPQGTQVLFMVEPADHHVLNGHMALIRDVNKDGWIDENDARDSSKEILSKLKAVREMRGSGLLELGDYVPNFITLNVGRSFVLNPFAASMPIPTARELENPKNRIPGSAIALLNFSPLPRREFFMVEATGKETRRFTLEKLYEEMEGFGMTPRPKASFRITQL